MYEKNEKQTKKKIVKTLVKMNSICYVSETSCYFKLNVTYLIMILYIYYKETIFLMFSLLLFTLSSATMLTFIYDALIAV